MTSSHTDTEASAVDGAPLVNRPPALGGGGNGPIYLRAADYLGEQIERGALVRGQRLSAERLLSEQLGVSRITVRRALHELAGRGLIEPSTGRGWYVSAGRLGEPPNALMSFTELGRSRGLHVGARVLTSEIVPADLNDADSLAVAPGSELLHLERLRLLDGIEIAVHAVCVPLSRAPGLDRFDFTELSLYQVLRDEYQIIPARAECAIEATPADARLAGLLGIKPEFPLLTFIQRTLDQEGKPCELSRVDYRGDRYRFKATIVRPETLVEDSGAGVPHGAQPASHT